MGSGSKKKYYVDMGDYIQSKEEYIAYRWCVSNNIYIAPFAKSTTEWFIDITNNTKTNRDPTLYKKTEIWQQIYKYYKFYYDKYKR